MRLRPDSYVGAAFYDAPNEEHLDTVLSHGLLCEERLADNSGGTIVVPRGEWAALCPGSKTFRNSTLDVQRPRVGFFRVDSAISERVAAKIEHLTDLGNKRQYSRDVITSISSMLRGYVIWRFPISDAVREHGIWNNEPNENTVTYNKKTGKKLGIHIDSWDGTTIAERQVSLTRFCVNLGPDIRDFLWVPYNLTLIASIVHGQRERDVSQIKLSTEDLLSFVRTYEDVPVFRMRLRPFEGYIADTDNLYHDASSEGAASNCYHYTLRSLPEGGCGKQGLGEVIEI